MAEEQLNPFAPPASDIESAGAAPAAEPGGLASRGRRFWGAMVDGIITGITMAPAYAGVSFAALGAARQTDSSPFLLFKMAGTLGVVAGALMFGFFVLNWYLLAKRGQTVGKIVARTRVVMLDGSRAPFGRVVALRAWPIQLIGYVPVIGRVIGPVLALVDVLFIFRADRRCLHDLIAGTKVVRVDAA